MSSCGGVDSASYIGSGGNEYVSKGGLARSDEVALGGTQYDHGVTSGTLILKGGAEDVLSGGVDYYATVYGSEVVSAVGSAFFDTVELGGALTVRGLAADATILLGGDLYVSSGGVNSASAVDSGGQAYVYSGGVDSASLISNRRKRARLQGRPDALRRGRIRRCAVRLWRCLRHDNLVGRHRGRLLRRRRGL